MFIKFKSIKVTLLVILLNLQLVSCFAQKCRVCWTIEDPGLIRAFWTEDGKHIGYISNDELVMMNLNGKKIWSYSLCNDSAVTNHLKILTSDGMISKLAIKKDIKIWEKKLSSKDLAIIESIDGFFATSPIPMFNHLKVFSDSGEMIWDYQGNFFNPFILLPGGKGAIGMDFNNNKPGIDIQLVRASKDINTIVNLTDPYFIEGPQPLVATNKTTKHTMIAVGTTPWWSIINNSGELILKGKQLPISKVRFVSSCGSGFALANKIENKVAVVSEKGKLLWTKIFKDQIQAITGNASFLAISIGNLGFPGKVILFNKDGNEVEVIDVELTLNNIEIADYEPLIIGTLDLSHVQLIDFTK